MPKTLLKIILAANLLLLISYLVYKPFITKPKFPRGDLAANMLLTEKIKDDGFLLTGHYSRFGFNHLGPFFFYWLHFAEKIPMHFGIDKEGSWIIAGILLKILFSLLGGFLALKGMRKPINFTPLFVFSLVSLIIFDPLNMDVWPANLLPHAFLAFFFSLILILQGRTRYLPISFFLCCALVHGYIALLAFAPPLLFLSILYSVLTKKIKYKKSVWIHIGVSFIVVGLFVLPIIVETLINTPSNLEKILSTTRKLSGKSFYEVMLIYRTILLQDLYLLCLIPIFLSLYYFKSVSKTYFFYFVSLFFITTILYYVFFSFAPGKLMMYTGRFCKGISIGFVSIVLMLPFVNKTTNTLGVKLWKLVPVLCFILIYIPNHNDRVLSLLSKGPDYGQNDIVKRLSDIIEQSPKKNYRISSQPGNWGLIVGILLELKMRGHNVCTTNNMKLHATKNMICSKQEKENLMIVYKRKCVNGCIGHYKRFGIISI